MPHRLTYLDAVHRLAEEADVRQEGRDDAEVDVLLVNEQDYATQLLAERQHGIAVHDDALEVQFQVHPGPVAVRDKVLVHQQDIPVGEHSWKPPV